MSRRLVLVAVLVAGSLAGPLSAQFGIVFDPSNYANALLRYAELQRQYTQLVLTYQQIRAEYQHLVQQARLVPVNMNLRYRGLPTPWLPFSALDRYGTIGTWIGSANTGHDAEAGFTRATQVLHEYGAALARLSAEEAARVKA